MIVVLDASAAVKLVLEERHSEQVRRIWDEPVRLIAPSIVLPEVAAAVEGARRAGRLDDAAAERAQRSWGGLAAEIDVLGVDLSLAAGARGLAAARPVRGMDAVYLVLALRLAAEGVVGLLSFDRRQRDALVSADGVGLLPAALAS